MAINRKVLCEQYASTEKNIEVPKHFKAFFGNCIDCAYYACQNNVYLALPIADICHQLKAIHNTTKYALCLR